MSDRFYRYFELPCAWFVRILFIAFVIALAPEVDEWDDLLAIPLLVLQGYLIWIVFPRYLRERAEHRAEQR